MAEERDAERAVFRYVPRQKLWTTENFATGMLSRLQDHAAAIHPDESVIVVVGGRESNSSQNPYSRWHSIDLRISRVSAFTAPDRLFGGTVGYDPEFPRILVFGGNKGEQGASDALWQLDLRQGAARPEATAIRPRGDRPPARYYHASVYDPVRRWLVVYGGLGGNEQPTSENRTWVFDATTATWIKLDGAWIGERYGATMVYDSYHQMPILIAGAVRGPRDLRGTLHYLDCSGPVPEPSATGGGPETASITTTATATGRTGGTPPASDTPEPPVSATPAITETATPSATALSPQPTQTAQFTVVATATPAPASPPGSGGLLLYMPIAVRP